MKNELELGKTYNFAGYQWVPVRINEADQVAVMQSLGVTSGPWPGYLLLQFGNSNYYTKDISGKDISAYNDKTMELMRVLIPVEKHDPKISGLFLPSFYMVWNNDAWMSALMKAACSTDWDKDDFFASWFGDIFKPDPADCEEVYAFMIGKGGRIYSSSQSDKTVVAPAFRLDLSKVEVIRDSIVPVFNENKTSPDKPDFNLLVDFLDDFSPVCSGVLSENEVGQVKKGLFIDQRDILSLRNLRNFTVLFLADKADIERKNDNMQNFYRIMDIQSGIVAVIDQQIFRLGGDV